MFIGINLCRNIRRRLIDHLRNPINLALHLLPVFLLRARHIASRYFSPPLNCDKVHPLNDIHMTVFVLLRSPIDYYGNWEFHDEKARIDTPHEMFIRFVFKFVLKTAHFWTSLLIIVLYGCRWSSALGLYVKSSSLCDISVDRINVM